MTTTQKWIAGAGSVGLTWATAFNAADLNSLANGGYVTSTISAITNGTDLNLYLDVDFLLGSITPTGNPYISLYLLPLLHDGSSYPTISGTPPINYKVADLAVTTAASAQAVVARGIIMPPGTFKLGVANNTGVAFAGASNSSQYRVYDFSYS